MDRKSKLFSAGQQTALGLSIQGISQAQMERLKARMEETKQTLERAQAAPESQREQILKGITGDKLTGDMLTATVWGYFASLQSQGLIAASQAQMVDAPALSYGLFHAQVKPNKLYGLVNRGVTFQGLNMDIGHLRHVRWVKDDDPKSQINNKPELTANGKSAAQNRWIAYNRMRGQYASAMEHAAPEAFWVDKTKCSHTDENGRIQNPTLNPCAEAISAVKAIAIAQSEGQKIYTINKQNAQTTLAKLPIGGEVGSEIRNAVNAGKEVTVHEKSINKHGWKGFGYIVIDPETGAGAYLIQGSGNGGEQIDAAIAKALNINQLAPDRIKQSIMTYNLGMLNRVLSMVEHAALTVSAWLKCNSELIINILVLAIILALIVAVIRNAPALAPAAVIVVALASKPAMAASSRTSCFIDCTKATPQILKITMPEPILGREHEFKAEYGATPVSRFDICSCKDGGIVIWEVQKCGSIPVGAIPIITDFRWK